MGDTLTNILQLTDEFKESIYKLDKLRVDSTVSYLALDDKLEAIRGMLFLFKPSLANGTDTRQRHFTEYSI